MTTTIVAIAVAGTTATIRVEFSSLIVSIHQHVMMLGSSPIFIVVVDDDVVVVVVPIIQVL